jgi:Na+-transporting methylmalonyl-CoA/oxaloacetate decarboxylase gamma subunit
MKAFLGPGLFLLTLAVILWVMGAITSRNRPRSEMGRYAAFEAEENKLLVPILAVLGLIGTGIGVWGYLYA